MLSCTVKQFLCQLDVLFIRFRKLEGLAKHFEAIAVLLLLLWPLVGHWLLLRPLLLIAAFLRHDALPLSD